MGKNSRVQHVGVGQDDVSSGPYGFPCILRGIAVIGEDSDFFWEKLDCFIEFSSLILGRGAFGGKEVNARAEGFCRMAVQNRKVIAERFSGSCGGDNHGVFSFFEPFPGAMLVGIELENPFSLKASTSAGCTSGGYSRYCPSWAGRCFMARIDSFLTPISFSISRDLARFSSFDMRFYPDCPIFIPILLFLEGGGQRQKMEFASQHFLNLGSGLVKVDG